MKKINNNDLAYIAGLVDGEGCIDSIPSQEKYHYIRVRTCNTNAKVIYWMKDIFGGSVYMQKGKNKGYKNVFIHSVTCVQAIKLLKRIYKFLRIKKEQAKVGLKFEKFKGNLREKNICNALLRQMNRRGR